MNRKILCSELYLTIHEIFSQNSFILDISLCSNYASDGLLKACFMFLEI